MKKDPCHHQEQKSHAAPYTSHTQEDHRSQRHQQDQLVHKPEDRIVIIEKQRFQHFLERKLKVWPVNDIRHCRNPASSQISHIVKQVPAQIWDQKCLHPSFPFLCQLVKGKKTEEKIARNHKKAGDTDSHHCRKMDVLQV